MYLSIWKQQTLRVAWATTQAHINLGGRERIGPKCWPLAQLDSNMYSKTCVKPPLSKIPKIGFQDQLGLNAGQKYCRMLQGEHSAIFSTFIKLQFVIKIFILSSFEWPFYTGFTVHV